MSTPQSARPAKPESTPKCRAPAGHNGSLNGHARLDTQGVRAVEGQDSPQASVTAVPKDSAPAGNGTAQPAMADATPTEVSLAGHQAGRDNGSGDAQTTLVPAADIPGAQSASGTQRLSGTGDQTPPAATAEAIPTADSLLADPLLSLLAGVLDDVERSRIANENRLRSLAGRWQKKDGQSCGFALTPPGFDPASKTLVKDILAVVKAEISAAAEDRRPQMPSDWHPVKHAEVWNVALIVLGLAEQEHQAELDLCRRLRGDRHTPAHPLEPWRKAHKGVGEKQFARLLGAVSDPYIRPDIPRKKDGKIVAVEPSRPRIVSELWALGGLNPVNGVARRRQKYVKANWSDDVKKRAFLVAEKCMQTLREPCYRPEGSEWAIHADGCECSAYRLLYDRERERLADSVHREECARCGPAGQPALTGSRRSLGHKKAMALRRVAKEILKDLWREARRIHRDI